MMSIRKQLFCCTVLAGASLAPGLASAQSLGRLTTISAGTLFGKCTIDQAASQPGTNFPGSAIEPWIAVDPTTGGHLLTGVQQDRWSNGGARGLRAGVSVNSGKRWTTSIPQGVSLCEGGRLQRSTDPWTAFGLDGTAYFFSLGFNNNPTFLINGESAQFVSRSTDGGVTWSAPYAVIDDTDPLAFNDKNSLTTDPNIAGNVYAVWDRLFGPPNAFRAPGGSDEHSNAAADAAVASHDGLQMARNRIAAARLAAKSGQLLPVTDTFGPTYLARSTDSGMTWERATPIYDPGRGEQTIGNVIVGLPGGKLLNFFTHIDTQGNLAIDSIQSVDHGFSWSKKPVVAVSPFLGIGAVTPNGRQQIRQADIIFSASADQATGNAYLVWEDTPASPGSLCTIFFSQSTDGGKSWSAPAKINQTPANPGHPLRGQGFNGTVVAAGNNTLVATYYDFRNDTAAAGQALADVWAVFCTPTAAADCSKASSWGREVRLTNASFNVLDAPLTDSGYFLGDYFGLAAQGTLVWPAFTATVGPGQTNLYTRPINLAATTAAR